MTRKLWLGIIVSAAIVGLPAVGNLEALEHPQLWILGALGLAAQLFQPLYKPIDRSAPAQDRGTGNHLVWAVYVSQFAGLIEAIYFRYPRSFQWDLTSSVALAVALFGLGLRSWSFYELGRFFTWHIIVQPDHKVVETGPYRMIRHPGYVGALVLYVATMIFLHAWFSAVLALVLVSGAVWRRVRYEEQWLLQHLGADYAAYSRRVKALVPLLW